MPSRPNVPGQPDPASQPEFYEGTPSKRFAAWLIDWFIAATLSAMLLPFTLFLGIFIFPVMVMVVGFFYRWFSITNGSATWGMRMMALELRDKDGFRLDSRTAFWHTALHYGTILVSPGLLISAAMTLFTAKKQGLHDMVLGTVALNRRL